MINYKKILAHHSPNNWQIKLYFLEDLYSLLNDGISLKDAVGTIVDLGKGSINNISTAIKKSLAEGGSLAEGLQNEYPNHVINIIRAGEAGGMLAEAVLTAINTLQRQARIKKQILHSITFPLIVSILALIVSIVTKETVLRNFSDIVPFNTWPESGKIIFYFAEFIEHWWWMIIIAFPFAGWSLYQFLKFFTGDMRSLIDRLPLLGIYRHQCAAHFLQTLGLLTNNGIIIKEALKIISAHTSPFLACHIAIMERHLAHGIKNIIDILDTDLLSEQYLAKLKLALENNTISAALLGIGKQYQQRNDKHIAFTLKSLSTLLTILAAFIMANIISGTYAFTQIN